jgi:hypothetical protein
MLRIKRSFEDAVRIEIEVSERENVATIVAHFNNENSQQVLATIKAPQYFSKYGDNNKFEFALSQNAKLSTAKIEIEVE